MIRAEHCGNDDVFILCPRARVPTLQKRRRRSAIRFLPDSSRPKPTGCCGGVCSLSARASVATNENDAWARIAVKTNAETRHGMTRPERVRVIFSRRGLRLGENPFRENVERIKARHATGYYKSCVEIRIEELGRRCYATLFPPNECNI